MGANELPIAIRPRPSVHAIRSAGLASVRVGGLDNAKMMGLCAWAAMVRTISSVKLPAAVDAPMSIVGCTRRTTSERLKPFSPRFQPLVSAGDTAYGI